MNDRVKEKKSKKTAKRIITAAIQFNKYQRPAKKNTLEAGDKETAVKLTDGWIYLFKSSIKGGQYQFSHEIYVNEQGKYQHVDLKNNFGKDVRKPASKTLDAVVIDTQETLAGDPNQMKYSLFYFMVFSRVQLVWSRLPNGMDRSLTFTMEKEIEGKKSTIAFLDWTSERGEITTVFSEQHVQKTGSSSKYYFWDPIDKAKYYHAKFIESRNKYISWVNEPNRYKKRYLHEVITAMSQSRNVYKFLDSTKFSKDGSYTSKEIIMVSEYEEWAAKQAKLMNSKQFKAIWGDFKAASEEQQSKGEIILAELIERLHEAKPTRKYLYEIYEDKKSFLNEGVFAVTRKSTQATYEILSVMSSIIIRSKGKKALFEIRSLIKTRSGIELSITTWTPSTKMQHMLVPSHPTDIKLFKRHKVEGLAGKITDSGAAKKLISVIEVVNLGLALNAFIESKSTEDELKTFFGLVGSLTDFAGAIWLISEQLGKKSLAVIGIISGVMDAVVGSWDMTKEINSGDYNAAIGQGTVAVGGLVMAAGAYLLYIGSGTAASGVGLAPGAIVLLLGAALEMLGTIIHFFADNDPIEDWINHCLWGNDYASSSSETDWSEGTYNTWKKLDGKPDLDKQTRALNNILYSFTIGSHFRDYSGGGTSVSFQLKPSMIHEQSIIYLEALAKGPTMSGTYARGPWKPQKIIRSTDGRITELRSSFSFPNSKAQVTSVKVNVRIDVFGDGKLLYPGNGKVKTYTLKDPLTHLRTQAGTLGDLNSDDTYYEADPE